MSSGIGDDVSVVPLYNANNGKILANFVAVEALPVLHRRVKRTDGSMAEQLSKNVTKILEDLVSISHSFNFKKLACT
jgi:hypothetical protein